MVLKLRAYRSGHIFCTYSRAPVCNIPWNLITVYVVSIVRVESDDIGVFQLEFVHLVETLIMIMVPSTCWDRLTWICLPCPFKRFLQKGERGNTVIPIIRVTHSGLIVDIPQVDSLVIFEMTNNVWEVLLVEREKGFIGVLCLTWRLHPLRIVHAWNGSRLWSKVTLSEPAIVEHHKHCLYLVIVGNIKEIAHSLLEFFRILLPNERMQVNSDYFHSDTFRVP